MLVTVWDYGSWHIQLWTDLCRLFACLLTKRKWLWFVCRSLDSLVVSHSEKAPDPVMDSSVCQEPRATSTPCDSANTADAPTVKAIASEGLSTVKTTPETVEGLSAPMRLVARRDRRVELSPPPLLEEPSFLINFSYHELEVRVLSCVFFWLTNQPLDWCVYFGFDYRGYRTALRAYTVESQITVQ